jgi:hypothetical protein
MAPPPHPFPVSHLPQRTHTRLSNTGHPKPRKLARDFDLARDCELMELVQYSCTPWQEMMALQLEGRQQECWPVVRLFRRYGFRVSFPFLAVAMGSGGLRGETGMRC